MIVVGILFGFFIAMFVSHTWVIGMAFVFGAIIGWGSHKRRMTNAISGVLDQIKK